jgi:hypothetical protein
VASGAAGQNGAGNGSSGGGHHHRPRPNG